MAAEPLPEPCFARPRNAAVAHEAHVVARAAGVGDNGDRVAEIAAGVEAAGDRRHGGSGIDRVDRRAGDRLRVHDAALRRHHQRAAGETRFAQPVGQAVEIGEHERFQRSVDDGRGSAAVFAQSRIELVRQRHGNAGQMLRQKLAKPSLMLSVDDRPQEADADRLDLERLEPLDDREHRRLIERLQHLSLRVNALGDFKCEAARHIGLGVGHAEVERLDAAALANDEHVAMALGRQKRGLGGRAGEDGVDRPRRAVNEGGRARQQFPRGDAIVVRRQLDRVEHAAHRIVRRRRGLEELDAITVLDHEIRERSARVARQSHHTLCRTLCSHL